MARTLNTPNAGVEEGVRSLISELDPTCCNYNLEQPSK